MFSVQYFKVKGRYLPVYRYMQNILTRTVTAEDLMVNASRPVKPVVKAIVITIFFNMNDIHSSFLEPELGGASTIMDRSIMSPRTINEIMPVEKNTI